MAFSPLELFEAVLFALMTKEHVHVTKQGPQDAIKQIHCTCTSHNVFLFFSVKFVHTCTVKAGSQYTLERALCNLPASRCDQKCIQNDLDVCHVRWNRNNFYSSVRARYDARPNHFVCTSGRNAHSSVYCGPAFSPWYCVIRGLYQIVFMVKKKENCSMSLSFCVSRTI